MLTTVDGTEVDAGSIQGKPGVSVYVAITLARALASQRGHGCRRVLGDRRESSMSALCCAVTVRP